MRFYSHVLMEALQKSYNPPVKNQSFCQPPLHKGAVGAADRLCRIVLPELNTTIRHCLCRATFLLGEGFFYALFAYAFGIKS